MNIFFKDETMWYILILDLIRKRDPFMRLGRRHGSDTGFSTEHEVVAALKAAGKP